MTYEKESGGGRLCVSSEKRGEERGSCARSTGLPTEPEPDG